MSTTTYPLVTGIGGVGGVDSVNGLTGTVTVTSSDNTLEVTSSGSNIDLTAGSSLASYLTASSIFMFSGTNSDIAGYESAPLLSLWTASTLQSVTVSVSTTPTLIEEFATNLGYPNFTVIPIGLLAVHYELQKASGGQSYTSYAEIYKRTSGGVETLIATTDTTTSTTSNSLEQYTAAAFITSPITLNATDRIVVKIYATLSTSSVNITLYWDDTTYSRLQLPTLVTGLNTGDVTLTTIGSSPNANAASLSGQQLQLQPASASFGGVVTTTTQSFAGDKTFTGVVAHTLASAALPAIIPTGDTDTGIWSSGANSWSVSTAGVERFRIGVSNSGYINLHGNFTATTSGFTINGLATNVPTMGIRLANSQSADMLTVLNNAGTEIAEINVNGYHRFPLGAVTTPTYSFYGDTNTGIYSSGADTLNLTTGGTERLRLLSGGVINTGGNYTDTTAGFQMSALGTTRPILHLKHVSSGTSDYLVCKDSSNQNKFYVTYTGKVYAQNGAYNDVSYAFIGSSKTGMYYAGSESIGFTTSNVKKLTIDTNGNLRAYTLHNNATSNGNADNQDIRSGDDYSATITNESEISGVTFERMQWLRVGNVVTVSGYGTVEATNGGVNISFEMSIPVPSNFSDIRHCAGMATIYQADKPLTHLIVYAETTNYTAKVIGFEENGLSTSEIVVHFTYKIR